MRPDSTHWVARWASSAADPSASLFLRCSRWDSIVLTLRAKVAAMYDERFCRMWEFYLQLCEIAYRRLNWMVFQAQIAKCITTVPLTRSYLTRADAAEIAPCAARE